MVKNYYRRNAHVRFLLESTTDFELLGAFKQLGYPVSGFPYKYCYKTPFRANNYSVLQDLPTDIAIHR